MKDLIGKTLFEGQKVAVIVPNYRNLVEATVIKVTPKGATVMYYFQRKMKTTSRTSNQIVVIEQLTGRLEGWKPDPRMYGDEYIIWGNCYNDSRFRFRDGQQIHTSGINIKDFPIDSLKEGMVVTTRNSKYLLGAPFKQGN